jgi:uncharacterized Zn finger protein
LAERSDAATAATLGSASLYCDSCAKETPHRMLRLDRTGRASRGLSGIARCRVCRWTHPFVSAAEASAELEAIVAAGPASHRATVRLPPSEPLEVDGPLPGRRPIARVRKIELRAGGQASSALAREVRTVWAVEEASQLLRVAVLSGARSRTERVPRSAGLRLTVGSTLALPGGPVTIVALRAHGHTWRRPGDAFPAEAVQVAYGRRTVSPPAGRRPWSRVRGTSSSRESSTSRSDRSRSSPGARRNRTVPRDRTASGGATERNSSP